MNSFICAAALLVLLVIASSRLACWVKTRASRKIQDRLVVGLVAAFAVGSFFCFSLRAAFVLTAIVAACEAADFVSRKGGFPDAS